MKTSNYLLLGCILLGIVAAVVSLSRRPATLVRIAINGTPGLEVKGSYVADGIRHQVATIVPTNLFVTARHVSYQIQKASEPGELSVELSVHCAHHGQARTAQVAGGCQGEIKNGAVTLQTTF